MRLPRHQSRRRGGTLVESAIIYPVTFFLLLAIVIGGYGIFRYQETAWLAREGARFASVRGADYASETGNAAATQTDVETHVRALYTGGSSDEVTVTVTWDTENRYQTVISDNGNYKHNNVIVTVSVEFLPVYIPLLPGTQGQQVSSTSVMPMHY